ncbi:hypothetical protein COU53_00895 [Candidatus Pacearchaeota archaeon CG10_big_fil_rev_8_21_14_0_10_30_48]|nr:MAG: hypothetical protein COU53_00895 [Candidatus Pacearchaeota archaeon CG10_big_fil_rev_8_21_14_0_10_30_48]
MVKKKKKNGVFSDLSEFMKKLGWVLGPILVVATIVKIGFEDIIDVKIAVFITIIILYIISLEIRLKKLEEKC